MQSYPIISRSLGYMCTCMDASSSLWHHAKTVGITTDTDQVSVLTETFHPAPVSSTRAWQHLPQHGACFLPHLVQGFVLLQ